MSVGSCGRGAAVIEKQGSKRDSFTFVQIADPQLGFCEKGRDWQCTVDNLKATVARINALKPAFVIVTGDLIHNWKNAAQAAAYREQIGRIDASIPVFHLPGNHDMPNYAAAAVAKYRAAFGYDRFAFAYNGSAFIGLNSNPMVCDSETARADARAQLEWFGQQLKRFRKCNHIFVFSHHPLAMSPDSRVTHKSSYDEPFRSEYAALMKRYGVRARLRRPYPHRRADRGGGAPDAHRWGVELSALRGRHGHQRGRGLAGRLPQRVPGRRSGRCGHPAAVTILRSAAELRK